MHQSFSGTPSMTLGTCFPQPHQEALSVLEGVGLDGGFFFVLGGGRGFVFLKYGMRGMDSVGGERQMEDALQ